MCSSYISMHGLRAVASRTIRALFLASVRTIFLAETTSGALVAATMIGALGAVTAVLVEYHTTPITTQLPIMASNMP